MGNLEIVSMLCEVTTQLTDLVNRMYQEMEQEKIAEEVLGDFRAQKEECEKLLDIAEYKMRRIRDDE